MPRRRDSLEDLRKRRASWAKHIGTRDQFAELAPTVVRELDEEIATLERLREAARRAELGEGTPLRGKSREERLKLLRGDQA